MFSFIPATILVTIGYFVLAVSTKMEGSVQTFGKILAVWIFIIAALPLIGGAYITLSGLCPFQ